jgi:hypothetical protein
MNRAQTERNTVLVGAAFAIGVAAGFVLREAASGIYERARRARWRREYERTVVYDMNLPDQLKRREPAPEPGQPRFGGTGAMGVSPEQGM